MAQTPRTTASTARSGPPRVLVTGASGYVGGRLVSALLEAGARVRAAGRHPDSMRAWTWGDRVEIAEVDLGERMQVRGALEGVDVVVFLVHAMGGGRGYADREARMARIMAEEAERAGVERIVYLSGLHPDVPTEDLSEHMASRQRVADILEEGAVPALVLQAATVIGGGSASFEIIRHLADLLPVMPAPRWVRNRIEPVAIADVLHYLVAAVMAPEPLDGEYELGSGESDLRFADLLTEYAEVAGIGRRTVLGLPVPAATLSGLWITLVTPLPRSIAMPLAQSMQHEAISHGRSIGEALEGPEGGPTPYREAVRQALAQVRGGELADREDAERARSIGPAAVLPTDPAWAGPVEREIREERETAPDGSMSLSELVASGAPELAALAGSRSARWEREDDATFHTDAGPEGRIWLTSHAEGDDRARSVRLVAAPEGLRGRAAWFSRRAARASALAALADRLAGTSAQRRGDA